MIEMIVQKLQWAGIRIESGNTRIVIDPLYNFPVKFGQPHEAMLPLDQYGPVDAVLITHHHGDHFDPAAIASFYGSDIPVYLPEGSLKYVENSELTNLQGVKLGETVVIGSAKATASYAADGLGDPQISWVVEGGGKKLLHSGDTLWHGYWWRMVRKHGAFDVVCLPVNAAVVQFPGLMPSGQPITMSPEQAVSAAVVLEAAVLLPIHYRAIHRPPLYTETLDIVERLEEAARDRMKLAILQSEDTLIV
ncbi:MBL fold metallo-hydrolase [Paenibacillus terricola]|nr:MBL fold metallo-hydrolase [Paenibacillus terricola]